MPDLFDSNFSPATPGMAAPEPLASRMRPQQLEHFYGQQQWLAPGAELRVAIEQDRLPSTIVYGPPGCGKTTLARLIAGHSRARFVSMSAVLSGVKELRAVIEEAQNEQRFYRRRTVVFVDEIHRWNKAQQDLLLPWVEGGVLILFGATTQNPYFEINSALLSRAQVIEFQPLGRPELLQILQRALHHPTQGYGSMAIEMDQDAIAALLLHANGDARSLLNSLEAVVERLLAERKDQQPLHIDLPQLRQSLRQRQQLYDKNGEQHYHLISAFIKSIRGSDPDAALYWLARMLQGGEDPNFIWRRLLISASEDIGLASPQAITLVAAAATAFDRVGLPEGKYFFAQATIYLALAAKSNSCAAFFQVEREMQQQPLWPVPPQLRDPQCNPAAPATPYLYPHDYPQHWVAQSYLPEALDGKIFYQPGSFGFEAQIHPQWLARRQQRGYDTPPPDLPPHPTGDTP